MPRFRTTRRKAIFGVGGAAATLAVTATSPLGQVIANPPDGSPGGAQPPSNLVTHVCGPEQTSIVKTESSPSGTSSVPLAPLPGANAQIVVPDGQSRCVKVLLTAETACEETNAADFCYVRALVDGVPMDPNGANFQAMDSEDGTAVRARLRMGQARRRGPAHRPHRAPRRQRRDLVLVGRLDVRRLAAPVVAWVGSRRASRAHSRVMTTSAARREYHPADLCSVRRAPWQ